MVAMSARVVRKKKNKWVPTSKRQSTRRRDLVASMLRIYWRRGTSVGISYFTRPYIKANIRTTRACGIPIKLRWPWFKMTGVFPTIWEALP